MNPLCALKYYGHYNIFLWEESFRWLRNATGPLDVPLKLKCCWGLSDILQHFYYKHVQELAESVYALVFFFSCYLPDWKSFSKLWYSIVTLVLVVYGLEKSGVEKNIWQALILFFYFWRVCVKCLLLSFSFSTFFQTSFFIFLFTFFLFSCIRTQ